MIAVMNPSELPSSQSLLRIRSDEDLFWIFVYHRSECGPDFWQEIENRKAAGILSKASPFWNLGKFDHDPKADESCASNLIETTREEWDARKRRKIFD
jgi:hypothetical protein